MTTVLLFHHALGQTTGFLAFAEELREAGHTVHAPDLYDGKTFGDIDEGVANAKQVGFGEIIRRGSAAAEKAGHIVYAGFSSEHARAVPGPDAAGCARGAVLPLRPAALRVRQPLARGVPLQIH